MTDCSALHSPNKLQSLLGVHGPFRVKSPRMLLTPPKKVSFFQDCKGYYSCRKCNVCLHNVGGRRKAVTFKSAVTSRIYYMKLLVPPNILFTCSPVLATSNTLVIRSGPFPSEPTSMWLELKVGKASTLFHVTICSTTKKPLWYTISGDRQVRPPLEG